ncbi:hypothetical protein ACLOAU_19370 [Niabella sp. CJ426]|uniref:hypothetical protein n=1 Tax=Niabella sp. CJ426 TaxID=3393740 RepID=UPI003D06BD31
MPPSLKKDIRKAESGKKSNSGLQSSIISGMNGGYHFLTEIFSENILPASTGIGIVYYYSALNHLSNWK